MDSAKDDDAPAERQKQQASQEEVIARRKAARRTLFDRLAKQPAMNSGNWTRDEAYDD